MAGPRAQPIPLDDHGEQDDRLHHGEGGAQAGPRSAAERDIGEFRPVLFLVGQEPLGLEHVRIAPQRLVPVQQPRHHQHHRPGGDAVPLDLVIRDRLPREHRDRRIEPQRLIKDATGVDQLGHVVVAGLPAAEHGIDLGLQARLDGRILRQQVQRPAKRARRRLVSGQEDDRDLVPDLLGSHALAGLFVARRQQQGQQVAFVRAGGAPVVDDLLDDPMDHRRLACGLAARQPRQPARQPQQLAEINLAQRRLIAGKALEHRRRALGPQIIREHGAADDLGGDAGHLLGHLDLVPRRHGRPAIAHLARRRDHGRGEGADLGVVERRHGHAPLAPPGLAVADEHAVADERTERAAHLLALAVVVGPRDQDVAHRVRRVGDEQPAEQEPLLEETAGKGFVRPYGDQVVARDRQGLERRQPPAEARRVRGDETAGDRRVLGAIRRDGGLQHRGAGHATALSASTALRPPKANEFDRAARTGRWRAVLGT